MRRFNPPAWAVLFLVVGALRAAEQPFDLMPAPASAVRHDGLLPIARRLPVAITGDSDGRIRGGVQRLLRRWSARTGLEFETDSAGRPPTLEIACGSGPSGSEAYSLDITPDEARVQAASPEGALHALATLDQLLEPGGDGWVLPAATIRDEPRFAWRGLLIDVSRHWEPAEVIRRNLDGMELVKLNVLHLHLTDDQGFRIESKTHPELTRMGSDGHYFTQAQMRGLIAYAWARGIRVMPEFDVPGHATSWVVSHPELASAPGPYRIERHWGVFNPVLDPTNPALYPLLADFLGEMAALFPDPYLHVGGDENNGVQWNANPRIQAFIREHGLGDDAGLHAYFNRKLLVILGADHKKMVGWDEILNPALPKSSVIQSWRGADGVNAAARGGYDVILSHGYYLDHCEPASEHYRNDPLPKDSGLSPEESRRVLGGEASMWGEWVSPETIDSRIWPRTAAIAERLWSPRDVTDVADMYRRLAIVDARLDEAGTRQREEPAAMVRLLAGPDASDQDIAALATVAAAAEPVKNYLRGKDQPWMNQTVPLQTFADATIPDGAPSRTFAAAVAAWLRARKHGNDTAALQRVLTARLEEWKSAATRVATSTTLRHRNDVRAAALALAQASTRALQALTQASGAALDGAGRSETSAPALERTAAQPIPSDRTSAASAAGPSGREAQPQALTVGDAAPISSGQEEKNPSSSSRKENPPVSAKSLTGLDVAVPAAAVDLPMVASVKAILAALYPEPHP